MFEIVLGIFLGLAPVPVKTYTGSVTYDSFEECEAARAGSSLKESVDNLLAKLRTANPHLQDQISGETSCREHKVEAPDEEDDTTPQAFHR